MFFYAEIFKGVLILETVECILIFPVSDKYTQNDLTFTINNAMCLSYGNKGEGDHMK